jgi:hypothetical protein
VLKKRFSDKDIDGEYVEDVLCCEIEELQATL